MKEVRSSILTPEEKLHRIKLYKRMLSNDHGEYGETQLGWPGQENFMPAQDRTRAMVDALKIYSAASTLLDLKNM